MRKFIIEDQFWELFPEAKIGIIVCRGIDNTVMDSEQYKSLLLSSEELALSHFKHEDFSSNEVIKVWREAFQKFKSKKGARSSIEAMLKRVNKGDHIGTINPLVDIYNSISLKYALPCGGEDMDAFIGDVKLTKALGNEPFTTLGTNENAPPYEGEIVYKDDHGAICRCWNWRESVRTMLTENTKNAFLCIELIDNERIEAFKSALNELAELVNQNLGGNYKISVLDSVQKEIEI